MKKKTQKPNKEIKMLKILCRENTCNFLK